MMSCETITSTFCSLTSCTSSLLSMSRSSATTCPLIFRPPHRASTIRTALESDSSGSPSWDMTATERACSADTFSKSETSMGLPLRQTTTVPFSSSGVKKRTISSSISCFSRSDITTTTPPPSLRLASASSRISGRTLSFHPRIRVWFSSNTLLRPCFSESMRWARASATRPTSNASTSMPPTDRRKPTMTGSSPSSSRWAPLSRRKVQLLLREAGKPAASLLSKKIHAETNFAVK
mmetsp:Transcript_9866/g.40010  ORF Transcript_9866/g.40010 Transcript_9866/m.40010 type:complete len:236 (+) Transcript_9866:1125-1832(+)